jgi:iron complex transport system substrate-binding protein
MAFTILAATACSTPAVNNASTNSDTVSITDEEGRTSIVPFRPQAIVCWFRLVAVVITAVGDCDNNVACSYECNFPPCIKEKVNVGSASKPNIELLLQNRPDLVIARTGTLFTLELRDKLENAGAQVIQFRSLELDTTRQMAGQMGILLDRKEATDKLISFIDRYETIILQRTAGLDEQSRPQVLFQSMGHMYWSNNADTAGHRRIVTAGGINIAANEPVHVPHLSAEWVLQKNPDITIYSYMDAGDAGRLPTAEELSSVRNMMLSKPGFKEIQAAVSRNVYIIDSRLLAGPRSIIGLLYYARWFHADLFADIDPEEVHREMLRSFWDMELEGDWAFPTSNHSVDTH